MGTQQILLIVLSVIIVGVAVAVGIQMFNTQAMNSNRQAVIGDLQTLGAQIMQFHRTPASQGGGGNLATAYAIADVEAFLGWSSASNTTDTGTFTLAAPAAGSISITGVGTETGTDGSANVSATLTVTLANASPLSTAIVN
ncbi:MAG: hypothetical protein P9X26_06210 [Candidatus Stygibacter frigidus]|nr:hypothetical protein [Candidatus Stygibacter frigidus]